MCFKTHDCKTIEVYSIIKIISLYWNAIKQYNNIARSLVINRITILKRDKKVVALVSSIQIKSLVKKNSKVRSSNQTISRRLVKDHYYSHRLIKKYFVKKGYQCSSLIRWRSYFLNCLISENFIFAMNFFSC